MIISCQNCFARFNLPDGQMPVGGRKVRCSSCSNVWFATAEEGETAPAIVAEEPVKPIEEDEIATSFEEEDEAERALPSEGTADKLAAIRAAMVEDAALLDEDPFAVQDKVNITEEDAIPAADQGADEPEEGVVVDGGVADTEEIDERFADDDADDDADDGNDSALFPVDDFDEDEDFDEDDVIARRRRKQREEAEYKASSRKAQMAAVGWVFLLLFFAAIASLFFMVPEKVVSWWPAASGIYDAVGVNSEPEPKHASVVETPKVRITPYASSMVADGDNYKLTLSGKIVNEGLRSVTIPAITFKLSNAEDNEISMGSFCLPSRILRKGQSVEFEHIISPASVETAKADFEIKWEKDKNGKTIDICASKASNVQNN